MTLQDLFMHLCGVAGIPVAYCALRDGMGWNRAASMIASVPAGLAIGWVGGLMLAVVIGGLVGAHSGGRGAPPGPAGPPGEGKPPRPEEPLETGGAPEPGEPPPGERKVDPSRLN